MQWNTSRGGFSNPGMGLTLNRDQLHGAEAGVGEIFLPYAAARDLPVPHGQRADENGTILSDLHDRVFGRCGMWLVNAVRLHTVRQGLAGGRSINM